jgi:hypothetical protein
VAQRPAFGSFISNWSESDLPAWRKLGVALRNTTKKVVTLSHCCGNHGEPGC